MGMQNNLTLLSSRPSTHSELFCPAQLHWVSFALMVGDILSFLQFSYAVICDYDVFLSSYNFIS